MTATTTMHHVRLTTGLEAKVLRLPDGNDPRQVAASLDIAGAPAPVLVVCGGAQLEGPALARARELVVPAVAEAARRTGAILVDGAADKDVTKLIGAARAEDPEALPLLVGVGIEGVTKDHEGPSVPLGPHHTHLVQANQWGEEVPLLLPVADALGVGCPIAVLLVGGGERALAEIREATRRGRPVFVVPGSGGLADRIAAARARPRGTNDAELRALATDDLTVLVKGDDTAGLTRRLTWALDRDAILRDAWRLFATYDRTANRRRRMFERVQGAILMIGLLATLLALLYKELGGEPLRWAVVAAPIVVGALVALGARFAEGRRWVVLRGAAEAVKSELFQYRTRTSVYADTRLPRHDPLERPAVFASRLDAVQRHLMHTEAANGALVPYEGPLPPPMYPGGVDDDGLQPLDVDGYLDLRVGDQVRYYQARVRDLERRRVAMQFVAITASGAGALVAALGAEVWVALTTALAAAALAYLGSKRADATIVEYNRTAARLEGLVRRWNARPPGSRDAAAVDAVVIEAEAVLTTEIGGWVQHMTETLRALQERQERELEPTE